MRGITKSLSTFSWNMTLTTNCRSNSPQKLGARKMFDSWQWQAQTFSVKEAFLKLPEHHIPLVQKGKKHAEAGRRLCVCFFPKRDMLFFKMPPKPALEQLFFSQRPISRVRTLLIEKSIIVKLICQSKANLTKPKGTREVRSSACLPVSS